MINFNQEDIGSNVISLLTAGQYPTPNEVVREYIQNSVDSGAKNIKIALQGDYFIVVDNGNGMSSDELRNAIRIAISTKNKERDVGYKGVGIYSGFHTANEMSIITKHNSIESRLCVLFSEIKRRMSNEESLVTVLNENIIENIPASIETKYKELNLLDFLGEKGTLVILGGISQEAVKHLKDEESLQLYLERTAPLGFSDKFNHHEEVKKSVEHITTKKNQQYNQVNISLLKKENGFVEISHPTAYLNSYTLLPPRILEIKDADNYFGFVWACLNKERKIIEDKGSIQNGFVIRKHGFAIGNKDTALKNFDQGNKYFRRYIGEIIIANSEIMPNLARTDIEWGAKYDPFFDALKKVLNQLETEASCYQENNKAYEEYKNFDAEFSRWQEKSDEGKKNEAESLNRELDKLEDRIRKKARKSIDHESNIYRDEYFEGKNSEWYLQYCEEKKYEIQKFLPENSSFNSVSEPKPAGDDIRTPRLEQENRESSEEYKNPNVEISGGDKKFIAENLSSKSPFKSSQENTKIHQSNKIINGLIELQKTDEYSASAQKLQKVYNSICTISAREHTVIVGIGCWCFYELLTRVLEGKSGAGDHNSAKTVNKYKQKLGMDKEKGISASIDEINQYGNLFKHEPEFHDRDYTALINRMKILEELTAGMIDSLLKGISDRQNV